MLKDGREVGMESKVLSLESAASLLGVSPEIVRRWYQQGVIPAHSQQKKPVFFQNELLEWGKSRRIISDHSQQNVQPGVPDLRTALMRGGLYTCPAGQTQSEFFRFAIEKIPFLVPLDLDQLHARLMAREKMASTAVGKGIALPHPRNPDALHLQNNYVAGFYLADNPGFKPYDQIEVFCAFLILATNTSAHLKIMGHLAKHLHNPSFYKTLRAHGTLESLFPEPGEQSTDHS
jgi:PTS system nitrogen regulatory IIA component